LAGTLCYLDWAIRKTLPAHSALPASHPRGEPKEIGAGFVTAAITLSRNYFWLWAQITGKGELSVKDVRREGLKLLEPPFRWWTHHPPYRSHVNALPHVITHIASSHRRAVLLTTPSTLTDTGTSDHRGFVFSSGASARELHMTRDISIQVAVATEADTTTVEVGVSGGDEGMRADVTELVLAHLGELWAQLEAANRIGAVELQDTRQRGLDA
jgi:hypothetical protein